MAQLLRTVRAYQQVRSEISSVGRGKTGRRRARGYGKRETERLEASARVVDCLPDLLAGSQVPLHCMQARWAPAYRERARRLEQEARTLDLMAEALLASTQAASRAGTEVADWARRLARMLLVRVERHVQEAIDFATDILDELLAARRRAGLEAHSGGWSPVALA